MRSAGLKRSSTKTSRAANLQATETGDGGAVEPFGEDPAFRTARFCRSISTMISVAQPD
jgi:hypothetical protein